MLDSASKIIAILGVVSTAVLGWLHFGSDTQVRMADALEAIAARPDELSESEDTARAALETLGATAQTVARAAEEKGYTNLPAVLITEEPIWVERNGSANWTVPGVGQVSVGVNGFNGGRAWVRLGEADSYYYSGTSFPIEGSLCTVFLETVDEPNFRAGFRMSCKAGQ